MVSPIIVWVCMLAAGSTLIAEQVLRPRLPHYRVQVQSMNPLLRWSKGEWKTRLRTNIHFHSDNYLLIDVHSLSFDLFYPNADGNLTQIGRVHDTKQQQEAEAQEGESFVAPTGRRPPLWRIRPRRDFANLDFFLYIAPYLGEFLWFVPRLLWAAWQHGSMHVIVPCTGVAHIKAQSTAPFTLSFVCDNQINLWSLEMFGLECAVHDIRPGWFNVQLAVQALRQHIEQLHPRPPLGGVFDSSYSQMTKGLNWTSFINKVALEEVIQHP